MTADRQMLVARSIAALEDQASIETGSLEGIKADLTRLGIDPEASIVTARKRAYEKNGPAERLLARLDDADMLASDIDALEKADIGDISTRVKSGAAASAVAKARQHAGLPSNVTALRTPGRRFWGWGSSIVGVAACLLLFVMTRPDQLYLDDGSMLGGADDIAVFSGQAAVEEAERDQAFAASEEPVLTEQAETIEQASVPLLSIEQKKARRASDPETGLAAEAGRKTYNPEHRGSMPAEMADASPGSSRTSEQADDRKAGIIAAAPAVPSLSERLVMSASPKATEAGHQPAVQSKKPEAIQGTLIDRKREAYQAAASIIGRDGPIAVLIIDPEKAPSELKAYAQTLPAGNLAGRLDEARALLENRPLIALLTVLRDGKEADAAVTLRKGTGPTRALSSFADSAAVENQAEIGSRDVRLEVIDLPSLP